MNWTCRIVAATCMMLGAAGVSPAGQVRLQISDGLVTLDARDATIREIFAEWARVGQTRVVNAERVPGPPITLQLDKVPERQALDILLRSVAGFVAAPRTGTQQTASVFDRIMLMPVSRPTTVPTTASAPASSTLQQFQRQAPRTVPAPRPQPPDIVVDDQDDQDVPNASMPLPGQSTGAPQPGMTTPNPYANQPNRQATPANPYASPYPYPYPQNPPATGPGGGGPVLPQAAPQPGMPTAPPANRPGMPTAPPPPPNPIK